MGKCFVFAKVRSPALLDQDRVKIDTVEDKVAALENP